MAKGLTREQAAIIEACSFQSHYSGQASEKFWREVGHLANDRTLYDFACALQDIEGRVLAVLNAGVRLRALKFASVRRRKRQRGDQAR